MNILQIAGQFLTNNVVAMGVSGAIGAVAWKVATVAWARFRPMDMIVDKYAIKWAYNKGEAFGKYYAAKIKNKDLLASTINDLDKASDKIQDSFISGLRKGASL